MDDGFWSSRWQYSMHCVIVLSKRQLISDEILLPTGRQRCRLGAKSVMMPAIGAIMALVW